MRYAGPAEHCKNVDENLYGSTYADFKLEQTSVNPDSI